MSKQVLILVDELELMDLTMGLNRLYDHWAQTTANAVQNHCSDDYLNTCNSVLQSITKLETKLNTIKEEQFK